MPIEFVDTDIPDSSGRGKSAEQYVELVAEMARTGTAKATVFTGVTDRNDATVKKLVRDMQAAGGGDYQAEAVTVRVHYDTVVTGTGRAKVEGLQVSFHTVPKIQRPRENTSASSASKLGETQPVTE